MAPVNGVLLISTAEQGQPCSATETSKYIERLDGAAHNTTDLTVQMLSLICSFCAVTYIRYIGYCFVIRIYCSLTLS